MAGQLTRRSTIASGSGGESRRTTGAYSAKTLEEGHQALPRKSKSSKSKTGSKKTKASAATSSTPSPSTTEPTTAPSPAQQPSETTDWVLYDTVVVPFALTPDGYNVKEKSSKVLKEGKSYKLVISGKVSIWPDKTDGVDAAYCYDPRCPKTQDNKKITSGLLVYKGGYHPFQVILSNQVSYSDDHTYVMYHSGQERPLEAYLDRPGYTPYYIKHRSGSIKIKIFEYSSEKK